MARANLRNLKLSRGETELLRTVFWAKTTSRSDVAIKTGYSRSKTNTEVSTLLKYGLLAEGSHSQSTGGRRAGSLQVSRDLGSVVGISINAAIVDIAFFDVHMNEFSHERIELDSIDNAEHSIAQIAQTIQAMAAQSVQGPLPVAAGVAIAGPVDTATNTLVAPPLLPKWTNFPVAEALSESLGLDVFIENDANAMALAHLFATCGAEQDYVVVKISMGIGAGIVSNGQLNRGANGSAGDIAHISIDPEGERCRCGNRGCVVNMSSGMALARAYYMAKGDSDRPRGQFDVEDISSALENIAEALADGEQHFTQLVRRAGHDLGRVLSTVVNTVNPSKIILSGRALRVGPLLLSAIRESIYRHSRPLATKSLIVDEGRSETMMGLEGAALAAFDGAFGSILSNQGRLPARVIDNLQGEQSQTARLSIVR